jgi:hypothetical protein
MTGYGVTPGEHFDPQEFANVRCSICQRPIPDELMTGTSPEEHGWVVVRDEFGNRTQVYCPEHGDEASAQ